MKTIAAAASLMVSSALLAGCQMMGGFGGVAGLGVGADSLAWARAQGGDPTAGARHWDVVCIGDQFQGLGRIPPTCVLHQEGYAGRAYQISNGLLGVYPLIGDEPCPLAPQFLTVDGRRIIVPLSQDAVQTVLAGRVLIREEIEEWPRCRIYTDTVDLTYIRDGLAYLLVEWDRHLAARP